MIDIDELERLSAQVTPLSWNVDSLGNVFSADGKLIVPLNHYDGERIPRNIDARYIVGACNAVPELIARLRRLEAIPRTAFLDETIQLHNHFMHSWGIDRYETAIKLANRIPDLILENVKLQRRVLELEKADRRNEND